MQLRAIETPTWISTRHRLLLARHTLLIQHMRFSPKHISKSIHNNTFVSRYIASTESKNLRNSISRMCFKGSSVGWTNVFIFEGFLLKLMRTFFKNNYLRCFARGRFETQVTNLKTCFTLKALIKKVLFNLIEIKFHFNQIKK